MLCQACGQDIIVRLSSLGKIKKAKAEAEDTSARPLKFYPEEIIIRCSPGLTAPSPCVFATMIQNDYEELAESLEFSNDPGLYNIAIQLDLFTK
jgi:hypothetical protein